MKLSQSAYIEVIQVTPISGLSCIPNVILGQSAWQNPANRFDVNNDGVVDLNDYNALITYLDANGPGALSSYRPPQAPYVDINGDGYADQGDLLQLAQYIATGNPKDSSAETCFPYTDVKVERDLLPGIPIIIKSAAASKNILPIADYIVFKYDYLAKAFTQVDMSDTANIRDCLIFVRADLITIPNTAAGGCSPEPCVLQAIRYKLQRYMILPSRQIDRIPTPADETIQQLVRNMAIIAIIDEADIPYVGSAQNNAAIAVSTYQTDLQDWTILTQSVAQYGISVRLCLLQPVHYKGDGSPWDVLCPGCVWPGDSNRIKIDNILVGADPTAGEFRVPRLLTSDILNAFVAVNANYNATYLVILKDNSGSISVSDYQAQLTAVESQLQLQYPLMEINNVLIGSPERWLQIASNTVRRLVMWFDHRLQQ